MSNTLLEQWRNIAYDESADRGQLQRFWGTYFQIEKEIYEQLLTNPDEEVKGPPFYFPLIYTFQQVQVPVFP